jgi:hypothetical protein
MKNFYQLPENEKLKIFEQISARTPLPDYAIEKDWWIVQVLRIINTTDSAGAILFKGGTSLSKGWNLIDRFSEDVDLAIDRTFLGVHEAPDTNRKLRKLREKSRKYLTGDFVSQLAKGFYDHGVKDVNINVVVDVSSSADPTQIEVFYPYIIEHSEYLPPRVLLEIGSRSMMEPSEQREISSFVSQHFPDSDFADNSISVMTVLPERTFLEKVFLLHEEFQKPSKDIRVERLSRHLYDIEIMMRAGIAKKALAWKDLYQDIVLHRFQMTKMKEVNYQLHQPQTINFIPPDENLDSYEKDYNIMSEQMIHGDSLNWKDLIEQLKTLRAEFNSQSWQIEI